MGLSVRVTEWTAEGESGAASLSGAVFSSSPIAAGGAESFETVTRLPRSNLALLGRALLRPKLFLFSTTDPSSAAASPLAPLTSLAGAGAVPVLSGTSRLDRFTIPPGKLAMLARWRSLADVGEVWMGNRVSGPPTLRSRRWRGLGAGLVARLLPPAFSSRAR